MFYMRKKKLKIISSFLNNIQLDLYRTLLLVIIVDMSKVFDSVYLGVQMIKCRLQRHWKNILDLTILKQGVNFVLYLAFELNRT